MRLAPDPVELLRPCYAKALGLDPHAAGWLFLAVDARPGHIEARLLRASALPDELTQCVLGRLRTARVEIDPDYSPPPLVLYVRFEPEP